MFSDKLELEIDCVHLSISNREIVELRLISKPCCSKAVVLYYVF